MTTKKPQSKTIQPKEIHSIPTTSVDQLSQLPVPENQPKLPPELEKKIKLLKEKLDKFKEQVLEKFGDYIVGITLLPPEKHIPPQAGE